jgi:hypothetical protein
MTSVSKQTTETLMAGERISEALELADREIEAYQTYEKVKEGLSEEQMAAIQPPPRNPILVAHNLEPEAWVLRIVEGVPSTALHDALLVLPFGKVMSLMVYLNLWAKRVSTFRQLLTKREAHHRSGMEYAAGFPYLVLPPQNTSSPDCGQSHDAHNTHTSADEPTRSPAPPEVDNQL